jgi:hypothetical protein
MNANRAKKRTEQAFVLDAYKRLRKKGVPSLWEASIMGRSADLVYLEENCLFTIEFKLKDWRRGLRQARDHQIGGDFAYLCIPNWEPTEALQAAAKDFGVGLFRFCEGLDWPFEMILPALRSPLTWPVIREQLFGKLRVATIPKYATS